MTNPFFTFIRTNEEGATIDLLASLVEKDILSISEIDPCCRAEVESEVVKRLTE